MSIPGLSLELDDLQRVDPSPFVLIYSPEVTGSDHEEPKMGHVSCLLRLWVSLLYWTGSKCRPGPTPVLGFWSKGLV